MTQLARNVGGRPAKTLEEHRLDGTFRPHRHSHLIEKSDDVCFKPERIPKTRCGDPKKWVRSVADELAIAAGCYFDERLAAYVVDWFKKYLKHSKGRWAGKPFELLDWQRDDIIYPLFGWLKPNELRRFTRAYIEIPKKNGKSTLASGIGLYMLAGDGEQGPEVYSCATDRDQASIVHGEAINMAEASSELAEVLKINRTNRNILFEEKRGYYRAISAKPAGKEGLNGNCWIADELHAWYGRELFDALRYMGVARSEPLGFAITTAGDDMESVCRQQHDHARQVIDGRITGEEATRFFGYIRGLEPGDDFDSHEARAKANPSLGCTIDEGELIADVAEARSMPASLGSMLRYRFNVWSAGDNPWLGLDAWAKCAADYKAEDLLGQPCWAGLDLARSRDFTAFAMIFHDANEDLFRQLVWFWLPEDTARERKDRVPYLTWADQKQITLTPGDTCDYKQVEDTICELLTKFKVKELAFDKKFANEIIQRIADRCKATVPVEVPQTPLHLAAPIQEYERKIMRGQLLHNRQPVLSWQAGHVQVRVDKNGKPELLMKPGSKNDIRTIDGVQAAVMALGRAIVNLKVSVYETRGIRLL